MTNTEIYASFILFNSVKKPDRLKQQWSRGHWAGSRAEPRSRFWFLCDYVQLSRGDESSSLALLLPAFPNDPAEHLLCQPGVQMMQLDGIAAGRIVSPRCHSVVFSPWLLRPLSHCSSPPSPLLEPIKGSQQSHPGGRGDTLEPRARLALGTSHSSLSLPGAALVTAVEHPESRAADTGAGRARKAKSRRKVHFHCSPVF